MNIKMKKIYLIAIILLLLSASMLFAWDGFNYIIANEYKSGIRVSWQAKNESSVQYYEIYLMCSDRDFLDKRASVIALGLGASYTFQDDNILSKSSESGDFSFEYFVRAVMKDGSYKNSDKMQVNFTHLGVSQQTWGSIKAMFR